MGNSLINKKQADFPRTRMNLLVKEWLFFEVQIAQFQI